MLVLCYRSTPLRKGNTNKLACHYDTRLFYSSLVLYITYVNYKGNNLKTGRTVEFKIPQPWPLQAAKGALLELKAKFGVPLSEGSGAQSSRAPLPTPGAFK